MVIPLFSDTGAFDGVFGVSLKLKGDRASVGGRSTSRAQISLYSIKSTLIAASRNGDQPLSEQDYAGESGAGSCKTQR